MSELGPEAIPGTAVKNIKTINRWMDLWFHNLRHNIPVIEKDFEDFGDRNATNAVPKWFKDSGNGCAIVVGSGPSAEQLLSSNLLSNWKGLVICGSSNATIPAANSRYPDLIFAVDSSPDIWVQLRWGAPWGSSHLITNPYIEPKVLDLFEPWRRYYYKSFIPYKEHPLNWYLTMLFNSLKLNDFMLQAGCTVNQQVLWCSLPKDRGTPLIKKVFLVGVDFAYPYENGMYLGRCPAYKYVPGHGWVRHAKRPMLTRSRYRTASNGMQTDEAMIGYKRSLLTLLQNTGISAFSCSSGIVTELPHVDLKDVIKSQGACIDPIGHKEMTKIYKDYIDREGILHEDDERREEANIKDSRRPDDTVLQKGMEESNESSERAGQKRSNKGSDNTEVPDGGEYKSSMQLSGSQSCDDLQHLKKREYDEEGR